MLAMSEPSPDDRFRRIRGEIRQIGFGIERSWAETCRVGARTLAVALAMVGLGLLSGLTTAAWWFGLLVGFALGGPLVMLWLFMFIAAVSSHAVEPLRRRREVRNQLSALSPAEQLEALLPLAQDASADTRRLVRPLVRALRRAQPGEVTACGPPRGGGRELAAPASPSQR
jgi:hypothetical protein